MSEPLEALFNESESTVLERMRAWANEGVAESEAGYVDTREGSFWFTSVMPGAREIARLYDKAGTEMVQAMLPQFSWGEYLNALAAVQQLERSKGIAARVFETFHAPNGTIIPAGTEVATTPAEGSGTSPVVFRSAASVTVETGGAVTALCEAAEVGAEGNVGAATITTLQSGVSGVESVSNANPAFGGANEETDEELAARLLAVYEGNPVAQVRWYIQTTQKWLSTNDAERCPRGGKVSVKPLWSGAGTVLVTVMDDSGDPVTTAIVEALQSYLDPVSASVEGAAPVAAEVTVKTGEVLEPTVAAKVTPKSGYNFTGASGLIAIKAKIEAALIDYFASLGAGEEVVRADLIAAIMGVEGVHDVSEVKLNGVEANVTATATQVPRTQTSKITLTEV
ncbi:MAG: baseplate J/gp47 family protein [Patescibacteria group bacterium]|nr:baseplate J/gp47 family protein [Patescibacteria group bacterium]